MVLAKKLGNQGKNGRDEGSEAISAGEFRAWMDFMGWKSPDVVSALGVSRNTVSAYRSKGAGEQVKKACRALAIEIKGRDVVSVSMSFPWEVVR